MEKIFQHLTYLIQSLMSVLKILIRSKLHLKFPKYKESEIFVLGNGPSLNKVLEHYQKQLKEKTLLCVNKFPDTQFYEVLKPQYFCIASPGYYNDKAIDYNVDVRATIIESYVRKTKWKSYFFIPFESKHNTKFISKLQSNKNINLVFYNNTPIEGYTRFQNICFNLKLGSPRPHNVLIPAILNSLQLKYKKIYLLGADHSWLKDLSVNDCNEVLLNQKHFYDEDTSKSIQMHKNHGRGNRLLHEVLEKFYFSFRSYHHLNDYAKMIGSSIINVTPNSFIDAFLRSDILAILNNNDED